MHLQGLLKPQTFTEYSKMQKHTKNNQNIELFIISNSWNKSLYFFHKSIYFHNKHPLSSSETLYRILIYFYKDLHTSSAHEIRSKRNAQQAETNFFVNHSMILSIIFYERSNE